MIGSSFFKPTKTAVGQSLHVRAAFRAKRQLTRPMQRTAQARFIAKWCCLWRCLKLQQIALVKYTSIDKVFCVVPYLMASVIRAAADWQRWALLWYQEKFRKLFTRK